MLFRSLKRPIEAAAAKHGIRLAPDPKPESVTFIRSDQYSFIRIGVPALFPKIVGETPIPKREEGVGAAWISPEDFVKDHYHRPSDDLRLPRHSESASRFVRFIADAARRVGNDRRRPEWNPGDFFGERFSKPGTSRVSADGMHSGKGS